METAILFIEGFLDFRLLLIIVFGGYFITRYTNFWKAAPRYKVLFASILFAAIFYFFGDCKNEDGGCILKYLFTYLFATSLYELLLEKIICGLNLKKK